MALVECIVLCIFSEIVNLRILEIFLLCDSQHLVTIVLGQKLAFLIQQLQGVPLAWIVRSCDDDTASRTTHGNSQLSGRSCGKTDVEHVIAHAHQGTTNHVLHHLARDTCITTHHDGVALGCTVATNESSVCRSKLHDVERIESIARWSADSTTDTRN